jgi:hypothetical protein
MPPSGISCALIKELKILIERILWQTNKAYKCHVLKSYNDSIIHGIRIHYLSYKIDQKSDWKKYNIYDKYEYMFHENSYVFSLNQIVLIEFLFNAVILHLHIGTDAINMT